MRALLHWEINCFSYPAISYLKSITNFWKITNSIYLLVDWAFFILPGGDAFFGRRFCYQVNKMKISIISSFTVCVEINFSSLFGISFQGHHWVLFIPFSRANLKKRFGKFYTEIIRWEIKHLKRNIQKKTWKACIFQSIL